ncbi:MAG TPA: Rossmann fold nucleotide-binding protein [Pseudolysinimonas sp.]
MSEPHTPEDRRPRRRIGGPPRPDADRLQVYTAAELFEGFDPSRPESYGETPDFANYEWFVATGRNTPMDAVEAVQRAVHDANVTFDLGGIIAGRRVVGVMGGHQLPRDSAEYSRIAELARDLARRGMLVCTGGGPGAMEAAHLGAALSRHPDTTLGETITALAVSPLMPDLHTIVADDGTPDPELVRLAGEWLGPAWLESLAIENPVETLSIPTWHYGHEPTSPFATHIAKLFQNSIREDGLLTVARQGIVFTRGSAGTLQEVFQDAQQNFYAKGTDYFSPMVFLGRDYWTQALPVGPLLDALFATAEPSVREDADRLLLVTDDIVEAAEHLDAFAGGQSRLAR